MANNILPGYTHRGVHAPSGDTVYILGIDIDADVACVSAWPEMAERLSEIVDIEPVRPISAMEIKRRGIMLGPEFNWA